MSTELSKKPETWGFPIEGCIQVCNLLFTNVEKAISGKMW